VLQEVGYPLPLAYNAVANQWEITGSLPWDKWDAKTRRLGKG
jgi:hypothetical protein